MDRLLEIAEQVRKNLEDWCAEHDGDMYDFFGDGSICGEDLDRNLLVGFGVYGSANIVITKDCVECGGMKSARFSDPLAKGLSEFRNLLENC